MNEMENLNESRIEIQFPERVIDGRELVGLLSEALDTGTSVSFDLLEDVLKQARKHNVEYRELDFSEIDKNTVFSRRDILAICDALPNARDQVVLLALFEGIVGNNFQEILDLKMEHIKGRRVFIPSRGEYIYISEELLDLIKKAASETKYYPITKRGMRDPIDLESVDDHIIKLQTTEKMSPSRGMYILLQKIATYLNFKGPISSSQIRYSGEAAMVAQEAKRLGLTPKNFIFSPHRKIVTDHYNDSLATAPSRLYRRIEHYLPGLA